VNNQNYQGAEFQSKSFWKPQSGLRKSQPSQNVIPFKESSTELRAEVLRTMVAGGSRGIPPCQALVSSEKAIPSAQYLIASALSMLSPISGKHGIFLIAPGQKLTRTFHAPPAIGGDRTDNVATSLERD
jgi:hypothetical protein